jgi:hypothetical protein
MITATSGLILNHGVVRGYRFISIQPGENRFAPEKVDNKGRVLLFVIDGVVEFLNIVYSPLADMLLNGTIVDKENLTIEVTFNGETETITFEPEDEANYAILASNPIIIEQTIDCTNGCLQVQTPGWKWDGEKFYK